MAVEQALRDWREVAADGVEPAEPLRFALVNNLDRHRRCGERVVFCPWLDTGDLELVCFDGGAAVAADQGAGVGFCDPFDSLAR
ncbi:hypothetical protein ICM05_09730 [Leucobacter sp. cx-42]|uniref:hypothetical protein n=1 Tax=unclassified Leucobacter TaxID=2621730 RepID=UPI00165E0039|nr:MULTISPECIES: hypothetical protein [unclassified Leucobacter]MBC9954917.1 hypothetical protein [Leucobacter sp. cx-42]